MFELGVGAAVFDIGHGVRAAAVADQQAVALGEIAGAFGLFVDRDEAAIGVVGLPRADAFGDDPAFGALAEVDHLGAGVGLLAAIGDGDGIELTHAVIAAQDAGRIFPRYG